MSKAKHIDTTSESEEASEAIPVPVESKKSILGSLKLSAMAPVVAEPAPEAKAAKKIKQPVGKAEMSEAEKAVQSAVDAMTKTYGKGAVMRMGQKPKVDIGTFHSGSIKLDHAIGVPGFPRGRITEILGSESSGKTTLALHAIASAQAAGEQCLFIDAEHALDPKYAEKLGVNIDSLLISQPDYGEQALEIAEAFIRSGGIGIVVIDSVAALVPKSELDGDMGSSHVGLHARLMSQAMRKLAGVISQTNTCLILLNQLRSKIGVMFGPTETTTGGNAIKFYATLRLDIRRIGAVKDGEENAGNMTRVKVVKNKLAPPFREAEFEILFGVGINRRGEILDLAMEHGIMEKSGSWFSYKEQNVGQGRAKTLQWLEEHPDIEEELFQLLKTRMPE